jgi:hypothetical protein
MLDTLRRFAAVYWLELRLNFHWSYLLFIAVWSGFVITTYTQDDYRSIRGLFNIVLGFGSLIGLFLSGIHVSRPSRSRFDMLEVALPTGVELLLARWLAGITALGALMIAPLIVLVTAPPGRLPLDFSLQQLLLVLLSFSFVTILITAVQHTVGIRRWMYPLFAVLWVGAGMIPNVLNNDGLAVPGVNLINFVTMNQSVNPLVWGRIPQGQLPTLTILFYVGLIALLCALMLWRVIATRFQRRSTSVGALLIAALGVVTASAASFTAQVHAANQQIRTEEAQQVIAGTPVLAAAMPFNVSAYDLVFTLGDLTQITAQITVANRSESPLTDLTFSLYQQFEITQASAPLARDGNTLTLTLPTPLLPGASTLLEITYTGNITFLERRLGRPPEAAYFIRSEGVYLPCAVLWYPVPGQIFPNVTLYDENFAARPTCLLDQPAAFRLTVNNPGAITFTSNLTRLDATTFASNGATWAQLIATSNLQIQTEGRLTVISVADGSDVLAPIEEYIVPAYDYLRRFFPAVPDLTVVAVPLASDSFTQWQAYPATHEALYVFIDPRDFTYLSTGEQNVYMDAGAPLIKSFFAGRDDALTENIAYFLWVHYLTGGDVEAMRPLLENGLPAGSTMFYSSVPFADRYQLANELFDTYVSAGEVATFDLLHAINIQLDTLSALPVEDLNAWIAETLNAD